MANAAQIQGSNPGAPIRIGVSACLLGRAVRYDVTDLQRQSYLEPHPKELMLRNHL